MFDVAKNNNLSAVGVKPVPPLVPVVPPMNKGEDIIKKEDSILDFGRKFMIVLVAVLGLSIVVLLAGYYFYILNFDKKVSSLEAEYAQKTQLNQKMMDWEKTIFALEAEEPKFYQMVPTQKDLAQVLVKLESLAQKYNLVFNSIENKTSSFSTVSETQEFKRQSYQVTLSGGDYFTLKKYLVDVESSLRVVAPKSLIYSPDVNMFVLTFDIYHR